jgi:FlaA1/EpsC-like NDP-sugar epimerase
VLIVGAGRSGRALARELAESPDQRVVGFLDDNPKVRRRRVLGIKVLGRLDEAAAHIALARPDEILVTIPDVAQDRLHAVVTAGEEAGISCRIVRRTTAPSTAPLVKVPAE